METHLKVWMLVSNILDVIKTRIVFFNICNTSCNLCITNYLILAEHDIFGEPVSDSEDDDEEANINVMELDENSRLSADSRVSDSNSMQAPYSERSNNNATTSNGLVTEFSKEMFQNDNNVDADAEKQQEEATTSKVPKLEQFHSEYVISDNYTESPSVSVSKGNFANVVYIQSCCRSNYLFVKKFQIPCRRVSLLFMRNWRNYDREDNNRRLK